MSKNQKMNLPDVHIPKINSQNAQNPKINSPNERIQIPETYTNTGNVYKYRKRIQIPERYTNTV